MAPATPQPDARHTFESQIRELYGRTAYTHKTHLKMADRMNGRQSRIKIIQIVVSAIIAGGAIGSIFADNPALPVLTAVVATLNLVVASYLKDVNPGAVAARHCEAGSSLWRVREDILSLLTDIRDTSISLSDLQARRDEQIAVLTDIYAGAPPTDSKAYGQAQQALKNNEELYFSDDELDRLLPKALRRGQSA